MKKRLLSALLALVMVLALLPVSVFAATEGEGEGTTTPTTPETTETTPETTPETPAEPETPAAPAAPAAPVTPLAADISSPENGKTKVTYYATNMTNLATETPTGYVTPGWWYPYQVDVAGKKVTYYAEATTGVINSVSTSGTWYSSPTATTNGKALTSFTLLSSQSLAADGTSLNVDLNGKTLTLTGGEENLTSVTVNDKLWTPYCGRARGTLSWAIDRVPAPNAQNRDTSKNLQIKATNAQIDSISLSNWAAHTVDLTNCIVGTISLTGKADNTTKQTLKLSQCTVTGDVTVVGNSSTVTWADTMVSNNNDMVLTGTGATLTMSGVSWLNSVTLLATTDATKKTAATPTVTVNAGTIGTITDDASEGSTNPYKININSQGSVNNINLTGGATLKIAQGTLSTGAYMTKASSVEITGPSSNVGDLVFVNGNGSSLKVTGTSNRIGNVICDTASNMSVDIAAEPTNIFGDVHLTGYKAPATGNGGVKGGKYASLAPATALHSSLVYQLVDVSENLTGFYTLAQLANALDDQAINPDGVGGTISVDKLTFVGQPIDFTDPNASYCAITFQNGTMVWGQICYVSQAAITLPNAVNGKNIQNWTATINNQVVNTYPAGGRYLTPSQDGMPQSVVLNAQSASADASKIINVTVSNTNISNPTLNNVRATLNGNVFTLTGAVTSVSGFAQINLEVTTDLVGDNGAPITAIVPVLYNNGITTFGNAVLKNGMVITTDFNSLRLSNDTVYTLNGSGLKATASLLNTRLTSTEIVATANVSGLSGGSWTPAQKQALEDQLEKYGTFTWNQSPAILQAINAAQATMTDTQIKNWITQAQRNYYNANNKGSAPTTADLEATGYDHVELVPYLAVNVTRWNETGEMTATLVPSYRVEVISNLAGTPDAVNNGANGGAHDPIVVKAGTSLGQLTGQMYPTILDTLNNTTTIDVRNAPSVNFGLGSPFNGTMYMHQDSTYVYEGNAGTYNITHAGSNGLGTVVINNIAPLVEMKNPTKINHSTTNADSADFTNALVQKYDNLQAAVDDTNHLAEINIKSGYTGSCAITMTGVARTITIKAEGNNVVTASGSGVTVTPNSLGHVYVVQLAYATTSTDSTTAAITTADVANGAATVSAKSAKSGSAITVTATPKAGYRTSGVTVTAHNAKTNTNTTVPVTLTSENVYTFTVPAGATSITVTPAFAVNTSLTGMPFTDVALNNSYFEAVKYVYDNGLMNGNNTAGTLFDGNATLNRAMVVTILYRASGSPAVSSINAFKDVTSNAWYAQAVTWASQNRIVEGYGNGNFGPTDAITREQLATILYRYNTSYKGRATTGSTSLVKYTDQGNVSDWATAGMQWAVGNGIVNGTTNTTLTPRGNATRYQAATMLMRYGKGFGL